MTVLDMATIVCTGPMIGVEFAVSAFINPILSKLDRGAQGQAIRMFAAKLGFVMPFWYGIGLVLLLAETFVVRHQAAVVPAAAASAIWTIVIVLTLLFLVPIAHRLARAEGREMTADEEREHKKWDGMHRWRVAALTGAMVMFLLSVK